MGAPINFLLKKEHKQEFIKRFRAEIKKDVEMGDEATGKQSSHTRNGGITG